MKGNAQAEHMNNSSQSTPYAQGSAQAELDEILNVLYMQGEDIGKLEYGSATHQITAVNGAKQAILQWFADNIVGQNETNPYIPMVASPTVQVHRDNQRQEQLAKLRNEGWQS